MSNTDSSTSTNQSPALYTMGRTIKAHIDRANNHRDKYHQHAQSAAILLIEAKAEVAHGAWLPWLDEHGIKQQTASRLMLEHQQPERVEVRRAAHAEREREVRAKANHPHVSDFNPKSAERPMPPPAAPKPPRAEPAPVVGMARQRLYRLIERLTPAEVDELLVTGEEIVARRER